MSKKAYRSETQDIHKNSSVERSYESSVLTWSESEFHWYLAKKNERIVTAIYALTDFFPAEDSLRWKLREIGTSLLAFSRTLQKTLESEQNFRELLLELSAFCNLSYYAGYLSEANFNIIKHEIFNLLWLIDNRRNQSVLPETFFSVSEAYGDPETVSPHASAEASVPVDRVLKRHAQGHPWDDDETSLRSFEDAFRQERKRHEPQKNTVSSRERASSKPSSSGRGQTSSKPEKRAPKKGSARKDAIVGLVSRKGEVSVKDIFEAVPGVSEKTLQRELLALVSSGVLEKKGERRWSRYSLRS